MLRYDNWRFLVTSSCNSKCFFCHRDGAGVKESFLDFQFFENIIREHIKSIRKIRFSGGEPLLHPDIFRMIKTALIPTKDISVVTNGLLLSKYIEQIKNSKIPKITVSLHSLNPDTFKKITWITKEKHHEIIARLKELKRSIKIKLNVVILKNFNTTEEEIEKIIDFVIDNDFDVEFIELDLGSVQNINFKKYHLSPNCIVDKIKRNKKFSFAFDDVECNWTSIIKNSKIEVHKSLCFNKLCKNCIATRPIIVYPNNKINRCRLGKPLIKGINIEL